MARAPISLAHDDHAIATGQPEPAAPAQTDAGTGPLSGRAPMTPAAKIEDDNRNAVSPELSPSGASTKGGLTTTGIASAFGVGGLAFIALLTVPTGAF